MAMAKWGSNGGYGYSYYSKPQVNYPSQNSEYVTTVVTQMDEMSVNENSSCYGGGGGGLQKKKAFREEVYEEDDVQVMYPRYNGGAVQKHTYKEQEEAYEEGGHGGYARQNCGGGGVGQKHAYQQEVHKEYDAGGYARHNGGGGMNKQYSYQDQEEYDAGEYDRHNGGGVKKHYSYHGKSEEYDAGGYVRHNGGAVEKQTYKKKEVIKGANGRGHHNRHQAVAVVDGGHRYGGEQFTAGGHYSSSGRTPCYESGEDGDDDCPHSRQGIVHNYQVYQHEEKQRVGRNHGGAGTHHYHAYESSTQVGCPAGGNGGCTRAKAKPCFNIMV